MSYVDGFHDIKKDVIKIVERDKTGNRIYRDYLADYVFYHSHPSGSFTSIYGDPCKKYLTNDGTKFKKELNKFKWDKDKSGKQKYKIFESDINPVFRCLEDNYKNSDIPKLNIAFFDIETGFCQDRGFAPVSDPFNPVTAISIYLSNIKQCFTLALRPSTYDYEQASEICNQFPNTFLFDDEKELLKSFLSIIEDSDCLVGYNSTFFDIPYLVNRITREMGMEYNKMFCLWNQIPKRRNVSKYGKDHETFDIVGRVHLDYLELYQKHNPQQQQSYRLDYIGEIEVGENKVAYSGTLDDLYHKDFLKFIDYSRQDVMLLVKIDEKKKFIDLANQIAHVNCVQLKTTMGSVVLVEQAIINEMHEMGLVVPSKKSTFFKDVSSELSEDDDEDSGPVVGAYVAKPKSGIHYHVGCIDINSLYPSVIRALNISPETLVGQIRQSETKQYIDGRIQSGIKRSEAWDGLFSSLEFEHIMQRSGAAITIDYEDGTSVEKSARQVYDMIFSPNSKLCLTANGTIFRTDKEGIIPKLLEKWYSERKYMQKQNKIFSDLSSGKGIELPLHILEALEKLDE